MVKVNDSHRAIHGVTEWDPLSPW